MNRLEKIKKYISENMETPDPEYVDWLIEIAEAAQTKVDYCACSASIKPLCRHCKKLEELFNN